MRFKLTSMNLKNFGKFHDETFEFNGNKVEISGKNGEGKTTIMNAYFWLMMDKDYAGNSNPVVATIGNEAEDTVVTASIEDQDGSIYVISKTQTHGGAGSVSNSYTIDSIPCKKTRFYEELNEIGIKSDLFMLLSNPNTFIGERADSQRSYLMAMAEEVNPADVARDLGFVDLAKDLDKFCIGDIKAKAESQKKAIEAIHGKKGVLTNARIQVIEDIKSELIKQKAGTKAIYTVDDILVRQRTYQADYEQGIADMERILFQIDRVKDEIMNRNEESINSHFNDVTFKLWFRQKDGQVKPCCRATIDGYELGSTANTAREMIAELNIINGLSKCFNLHLPIFIDGAEALDTTSRGLLKASSQLILSSVASRKNLSVK